LPNTVPQCGVGGAQCVSCGAGNACTAQGQCVCTAASCPHGCCANGPGNRGACLPGNTDQSCGTGGARCAACSGTTSCHDQQCLACGLLTCPNGCCDGNGVCQPGNTLAACGTGGVACAACGNDEDCENGQCGFCPPSCICMGQSICSSGEPQNVLCGGGHPSPCVCMVSAAGQPICVSSQGPVNNCTTDTECQSFVRGAVCVNAGPAGSLCPTEGNFCAGPCCNAQSCANGCCDGGRCQPGNAPEACGTGGGICAECGLGQACRNGQCTG
jgi:hypothetical protein